MFKPAYLKNEKGNTVIIFLFIMATLAALAVGALQVTTLNLESSHAHRKGKKAFYAAEVGLDLAINDIMSSFENLSVYTNTASNGGDGEGYLTVNNYRGYDVKYRITNPQSRYLYQTAQGNNILSHYAYSYNIDAESISLSDNSKETLQETIRILETPLVQWFIFYGGNGGNDSDLEITPGPGMTAWGRIHSNGDIYLRAGCSGQLNIQNFDPNGGTPLPAPHSITAAGIIRNWHKGQNAVACTPARIKTTNSSLIWEDDVPIDFFVDLESEESGFNDFVFVNEPIIQAPSNTQFVRNGFYDQRAGDPQRSDVDGIRILGTGGLGTGITVQVSRPAPNTDVTALVVAGETSAGTPYSGPMPIIRETTGNLNDCREDDAVDTTDIDLYALELWYQEYLADPANGSGALAGSGFLVYASRSPDATFTNSADPMQAIRLMQIGGGSTAQLMDETTFASDNPIYIDSNFNTVSTQGAAIIGDAINLLGQDWDDSKTCGGGMPDAGPNGSTRIQVRAALFGGYTPTTSLGGTYGGGLHNYMRYHENWDDVIADFKGSMIGLWVSQQAVGNWCQHGDCYEPPDREYGWDTRFGDPDFWPPFIPSIFGVERVGFLE
ncbi:MAG: hypothetical protein NPINA01_19600 [Nitrospinaceae bacterium]|nr:MAG: hypothetical protein NPINA01_19600 [Nitrospinaceae bacterium]